MASCLKRTRTAIAIFKAILSRTLFALHGFICIWRVTVVKAQPLYWCLTGTLPVMVLETIFTIKKKKGGEWKWVCPSVLLYLGTAVPAIWFLELDLMRSRMNHQSSAMRKEIQANHIQEDAISNVLNGKLLISLSLGREEWCKILEQMLLLLLIVGRWLLPKGEITREQLSQLLLVYIGMAADIIELFEAFKEDEVRQNTMLTLIILALWTASLTQFTFVLTATKAKRTRPAFHRTATHAPPVTIGGKSCCQTEVLSIVMSMTLQDGPFLVLRLLLILRYDVLSYTNIFFTCKNTLILVLQFYRLVVLFCQKKQDDRALVKNLEEEENGGGNLQRSAGVSGGRRIKKVEHTNVRFSNDDDFSDDEGVTSDDEDEGEKEFTNVAKLKGRRHIENSDSPKRSQTNVRRESLRRQEREIKESPYSSMEWELDGNYPTGSPSSHSSYHHADAEIQAMKRLKGKAGRRKVSEDSTRGSMSDSREEVRKGRGGGKTDIRRQRSGKDQWQDVKILAKSVAFISEAGRYKTLVLKPVKTTNDHVVYILEPERGDVKTKYV